MATMIKKVKERLQGNLGRYQQILKTAKDRDVNEADTIVIVKDMMADVFGYDKYLEITGEYAIRGTFCDLAVKIEDKIWFLIEVKAIGVVLKEGHLRQALQYGASQGIAWIVLTNGHIWQIYKLRFEKPMDYDLVCEINILELNPKKEESQEKLFILCKEGLKNQAREEFHQKIQCVNRFVIAAILMGEDVANVVRREIRRLSPEIKPDICEIQKIIENDVLKRDVVEGEEAKTAQAKLKRSHGKTLRQKSLKQDQPENETTIEQPKINSEITPQE